MVVESSYRPPYDLIQVELDNVPHRLYGFVSKLNKALAGVGRKLGRFQFSGDKAFVEFLNDGSFQWEHRFVKDGFLELSDKTSTEKVLFRVKGSGSETPEQIIGP